MKSLLTSCVQTSLQLRDQVLKQFFRKASVIIHKVSAKVSIGSHQPATTYEKGLLGSSKSTQNQAFLKRLCPVNVKAVEQQQPMELRPMKFYNELTEDVSPEKFSIEAVSPSSTVRCAKEISENVCFQSLSSGKDLYEMHPNSLFFSSNCNEFHATEGPHCLDQTRTDGNVLTDVPFKLAASSREANHVIFS